MNPTAAEFKPQTKSTPDADPSPHPPDSKPYDLRETDDRGFGLFANRPIPLGTLVICERPLLQIATNNQAQVWDPYHNLSDKLKAVFDGLHLTDCPPRDLVRESRAYLANHVDSLPTSGNITTAIATHVRIMKIFAANHFHIARDGLAVYAAASRLNHSCVPNVHHSYNPTLGSITVYAVRDILPDEELVITYLGSEGTYQTSTQRLANLESAHGFVCRCPACSDMTGTSDGRRLFMKDLVWGLAQFNQGVFVPHPFIPSNPFVALKQAEDHVSCMLEEGIVSLELTTAFRMASAAALVLGDLDRALEYARDEAAIERNCLGSELSHLRNSDSSTEKWTNTVFDAIRAIRGEEAAMMYRGVTRGEKKKKKKNVRSTKAKMDANNALDEPDGDSNGQ